MHLVPKRRFSFVRSLVIAISISTAFIVAPSASQAAVVDAAVSNSLPLPLRSLVWNRPISLAEARWMVRETDDFIRQNSVNIQDKIDRLLKEKDEAQESALAQKQKCAHNPGCIKKVHEDLKAKILTIHDKIRVLNADKEKREAKSRDQARLVLKAALSATVAGAISKALEEEQSKGELQLETPVVAEWLMDNEDLANWYNREKASDKKKFTPKDFIPYPKQKGEVAVSFFMRTTAEEVRVLLQIIPIASPAYGTELSYDELKKSILAPDAETQDMLFSVEKSWIKSVVIQTTAQHIMMTDHYRSKLQIFITLFDRVPLK